MVVRHLPVSYTHLDVYKRQLLFFGEAYHITEVFPNYFLDYREECDDKAVRWLFRTHSNEGDWSGNCLLYTSDESTVYGRFWNGRPAMKSQP